MSRSHLCVATVTHSNPQLDGLSSDRISFDESFDGLNEACVTLSEYYVDTRYPDTLKFGQTFASEGADIAVTHAAQVLDFVSPRIGALLAGEAET
jgi:HEPN domain-containing protein